MEISNKKIRDILRENLLKESQESTSQHEMIKYAINKIGWNKEEANKFVRVDLRNDITSLRHKKKRTIKFSSLLYFIKRDIKTFLYIFLMEIISKLF